MTYREHLQELYDRHEKSSAEFMKLHNEISLSNGFDDANLPSKYLEADQQWKHDHNQFFTALSFVRDNKINLDDTLTTF